MLADYRSDRSKPASKKANKWKYAETLVLGTEKRGRVEIFLDQEMSG
jgi:hypothetical protein